MEQPSRSAVAISFLADSYGRFPGMESLKANFLSPSAYFVRSSESEEQIVENTDEKKEETKDEPANV